MIELVYPLEAEDRFLLFKGIACGPSNDAGVQIGQPISWDSELQSISGTRGQFGENNVEHEKLAGNFVYQPFLGPGTPASTAQYPHRILLPAMDMAGNNVNGLYAQFGAFCDGICRPGYTSTALAQLQCLAMHKDPVSNRWCFYEVAAYASSPRVILSLYRYEILSVPTGTNTFRNTVCRRIQYYVGSGKDCGVDLRQVTTWGQIDAVAKSCTVSSDTSSATVAASVYRWRRDGILPPAGAKEVIDALVATILPSKYPVESKHYGDLAADAVQHANANRVNMIAFLKDLRHPTEMIPKLRNLRSLKSLADDYLSVKYGILPTMDDLKSIEAAFRRLGPYLDRNGFETYSASYRDSKVIKDLTFDLEQHIKLAIAKEDSTFLELVERLERAGFWPTAENVWDLAPFSFVIDWFVDVGDFLERIDSTLRLTRLNMKYVTSSQKLHVSGKNVWSKEFPFDGSIDWVQYHRWTSDQCPVPSLSLNNTTLGFDHWLESSALILQRARK